MKQIFASSAAMLSKPVRGVPEAKYPWKELKVGESFPVDAKDIKLTSLRPFATRMGKKLGKKFRVINYGDSYEVGCIPMTETEAVQTSSNVVEALGKVGQDTIHEPGRFVETLAKTPWDKTHD